ncbi:MAG: hypothetical protein AB2L11_02665 [Syntrophobacteraceae bacterium]
MEDQVELYVPVSYAADMLGCHWREVYTLINKGTLNFIRMPRNNIKVSAESVYRHLQQQGIDGD